MLLNFIDSEISIFLERKQKANIPPRTKTCNAHSANLTRKTQV